MALVTLFSIPSWIWEYWTSPKYTSKTLKPGMKVPFCSSDTSWVDTGGSEVREWGEKGGRGEIKERQKEEGVKCQYSLAKLSDNS